jgi:hypothetical protein
VSEVPESLRRLNLLLEALAFAHETIYDLHLSLVDADRATPASRALLAESAQIVLQKTAETSASARALASRWHEQAVLDPTAAEQTAPKLDAQVAQAESILRELLARETEIASQLKGPASDSR